MMAPMVLIFQESEKLNQWTNNIIGAIDLLEITTEMLCEVNIKFVSQSRATILTGKVAKKETQEPLSYCHLAAEMQYSLLFTYCNK